MNAAETIQEAIDRLTFLRSATTQEAPSPWRVGERAPDGMGLTPEWRVVSCGPDAQGDVTDYLAPSVADLIATLYATIDAQLAVLESSFERELPDGAYDLDAFTLARSILGEQLTHE